MVEVCVRNQYQINARQVFEMNPRPPEPLQHKQPAGKVWIHQNIVSANLHQEPGVSDKSNSQVILGNGDGSMTSSDAWG